MQTRSRRVEMPNGLSLGLFAVELAFGMNTSSDWLRPVSLLPERKRQCSQPLLDPVCFDVRKILAVDAGRALVGAAPVSYTHLTLPTKRIV